MDMSVIRVDVGKRQRDDRTPIDSSVTSGNISTSERGLSSNRDQERWSAASAALTVLVVDDEVHIVDFLTVLLEEEGCTVFRAFNGLQAWEVSEQCHPDLVISDVMMPGLTGVELARRIKAAHNGSAPRIVLMSAVKEIATMPGVEFLRKPFDIERILDFLSGR